MYKEDSKGRTKNQKNAIVILAAEMIALIAFAAALSFYMGLPLAICISAVLFIPFYLVFRKVDFSFDKNIKCWVNGMILSGTFGYFVMLFFDLQMKNLPNINRVFLFVTSMLCLLIPSLALEKTLMRRNRDNSDKQKTYLHLSLSLMVLYFVVMIDIPSEVFLNNASEFSFTFKDELLAQLMPIPYLFLACFVFSLLPPAAENVFFVLISALNVCVYIQHMFFNGYVGRIIGGAYDWKEHVVFSIVSLGIWILLFACTFVIKKALKNKAGLYLLTASGVVFILLFVSFVSTIIKAPEEAFQYDSFYVSGKEQFTVGKNNNTILFVIDALDNRYIEEILADDPEFFAEFNDFTLYTDTCSVYDLTAHSIPNMILGYTSLEEDNRGTLFLKRFHDNGYRILFYNVFIGMITEYIDNYEQVAEKSDLLEVDYNRIRNDMTSISIFQCLPCVLKKYASLENLTLTNYVQFGKDDYEMIGNNSLFEENLKLTYNENSDNCFYYHHLEGAHFPCEDMVGESKHCLAIFKEYMRQLKELGVYDAAAIVVCADHGRHDDDGEIPFPTASTPMFMVKKSGEKHDVMQISNAPMYYMDFQSTLLVASGLFDPSADYEMFGKSVFDYKEGDIRTRTWFDTDFHGKGILKITYKGDTSELERVVEAGEYEKVDSWDFEYCE